jgi:sigma-B regulation protein RsbU (phosphoserine phosphatase)
MIVDDMEANINILVETLGEDYDIRVAMDGESALEYIEDEPPDLILLDIMMPGLDGYEVCRRLKINKSTRDIPIIFITALGEMEDEAQGLELGAIDFLRKPISPPLVKARVKNHLELHLAKEELENQNLILERRIKERTREIAELHRVEYELRIEKEKVEKELNIASEIQQSILPSVHLAFPHHKMFDLCAGMKPARMVGGDFYDFFFVDNDRLALVIGDVSDKGVPAALFMMVSRTVIRSIAGQGKSPSRVLTEANKFLCEGNETGMFVTVIFAHYELFTGRLTVANAGHNPGVILEPNGGSNELLLKGEMALGLISGLEYTEERVSLNPGQTLIIYTDGVTEAMSPDKEFYGKERFLRLLRMNSGLSLKQLCATIERSLDEYQQGHQFDDITIMALRNLG